MASKVINLGLIVFSNIAAAYKFFQGLLRRYGNGGRITGRNCEILKRLLERYPDPIRREEIFGCGISHFEVWPNMEFQSKGFVAIRHDGTPASFSYRKCVTGTQIPPEKIVFQAMRSEIGQQVFAAKCEYFDENADEYGRVPCAETGQLITMKEAHADHAPPRGFDVLARMFLSARRIIPSPNMVDRGLFIGDRRIAPPRLRNSALSRDWVEFHAKEANIRVVSKRRNLSQSHLHRVKPRDRQLKLDIPRIKRIQCKNHG